MIQWPIGTSEPASSSASWPRTCRRSPVAASERAPILVERRRDPRRVDVDRIAVLGRPRQQHPGLLERLADRRDPDAQRTGGAEHAVGGGGVDSVAAAHKLRIGVLGVDRATREDVGAGHEHRSRVPPQHEHVQVGTVSHEHHGCGVAGLHLPIVVGALWVGRAARTVHRAAEPAGVRTHRPAYAYAVTDPRRALPRVERVLAGLDGLPHMLLVDCARGAVTAARTRAESGEVVQEREVLEDARARVEQLRAGLLGPS